MRRAARFRLPLELAIASAGMATACTAPPTEPRDRRTDAAADEPASAPETRTPTAAAEGAERVGSTPAAARLASCLRVTPLIAEIACVLPSGLAIGVDGTASRVGDDGELTRVARLPDGARCPLLAHDPATGKLWWAEAARLHQLDLATGTEDWQRALSYPDAGTPNLSKLLALDGEVVIAGALPSPAPDEWRRVALIERIDATGKPRWTSIGLPGFGFTADRDGEPLTGVRELYRLDSGVGVLGEVSGIDSAALTLATLDAATGEQRWSTALVRDTLDRPTAADGHADLLASVHGSGQGEREVILRSAVGQTRARYAVMGASMSKPGPEDHTRIVGERIYDLIPDPEHPTAGPTLVERGADGSERCTTVLPELAWPDGTPTLALWRAGDTLVVTAERGSERRAVLVRP